LANNTLRKERLGLVEIREELVLTGVMDGAVVRTTGVVWAALEGM